MAPATFEARLIAHRSLGAIIRLTWMPVALGLLVLLLARALESVSADAAELVGMLSGLPFVAGVLYIGYTWRRGPALALTGGVLTIGARRAPLPEVQRQVGEYVFRSQSRHAPGTFWMPLLTLRFADGEELRVGCEGGGGPGEGRQPTTAPHNLLPAPQWDQLVAALDTRRAR